MQQRINNTLGRIMITGDEKSWDYGFLESLQEQITTRGSLSPRQQEILQQVEGRYSDEALKSRASWAQTSTEDQDTKFNIALKNMSLINI